MYTRIQLLLPLRIQLLLPETVILLYILLDNRSTKLLNIYIRYHLILYMSIYATKFAEHTALPNEGLKMKIDIRSLQPLNLYTEVELQFIMDEAREAIGTLHPDELLTDNGVLEAYESYIDIQLDASMELQNRLATKDIPLHTSFCICQKCLSTLTTGVKND